MANTYRTIKNIARKALPTLIDNLVMPNLVYKDYSKDFVGKGDTIQIERPPQFTADDFDGDISIQDATFGSVDVTIDKLADISVEITHKDLTLEDSEFERKVIEPMATALAEKINSDGLELALDIPYYDGTAGTTPDTLEDMSNIRLGLNNRKVPLSMRRAVWDPEADAKFTQLGNLVKVNESGSPSALREGEIGRVYGLDNYMSQAVKTHVAGTFTAVATPLTAGVTAVGATSIALDGGAGTETIKIGDLMTIAGVQYVATADAAAVGGAVTVAVYPAVAVEIPDNTAVVFPDKTATASVRNLGFHQNAFAFVTRSLPLPTGSAEAYVTSFNGITLRVVKAYDIVKKKDVMSMDVLYGYKTIYPELAHVVLG